jgi:hypothetical protein
MRGKRHITPDGAQEAGGQTKREGQREVRNILAVLIVADTMEGVRGPPGWRITSWQATAGAREASRFQATGASPLTLKEMPSQIWIWRMTTDE